MKSKPIIKKIVMGKFKGKTLKLPSKETTRSSKSIVLESFFNTVQFEIIDSVFVEVFSGSGSIGLEALSRGAKKILFMEQDRDALKVLKENISVTDASACEVFSGDSFANIQAVLAQLKRNDEIMGARLGITSHENVVLFEDVIAKIETVDIAKARIFASAAKRDEE